MPIMVQKTPLVHVVGASGGTFSACLMNKKLSYINTFIFDYLPTYAG